MKNKSIIIAAITAMSFLSVNGQETVVLKNGSRYMGHTSSEDFVSNSNTFVFMADSATVVEKLGNVYFSMPEKNRVNNMKNAWKKWFKANPSYTFFDGDTCAWLGNVSYKSGDRNEFSGDARIISYGDDEITFFSLNQANVTIDKIKDVDHYEYAPRDPLALVGVIDEIELDNGDVLKGQIVAEYPAEFDSLRVSKEVKMVKKSPAKLELLMSNGVKQVIKYDNIKAKRIIPYNPNYKLNEQLPYFSRITYKTPDGKEKTIEGIIVEKVYMPGGKKKSYYLVADCDGMNKREYDFDDVVRLGRTNNSRFIKGKDIVLSDRNDILIGSQTARKATCVITDERFSTADSAAVMTIPAADVKDGVLKVYFKDLPGNDEFYFVEARQGVKPAADSDKKKKKDNKDEPAELYYATMSFFNGITPEERFVSPNGNVALSYLVTPGKAYFLLRKSDKAAFVFLIEK